MPYNLPPQVYEPDMVAYCAEELKTWADSLRRPAKSTAETLSLESQALLAALPATQAADPKAIDELADQLQTLGASAPRLTITLAAFPGPGLRTELVTYLRAELKANLLVSFRVSPDIAGGMLVRTTNRLYDLSFRRQLLESPAGFTEALRHV